LQASRSITVITTAQTDFAKSSFEASKAYFEQLAGVKSPDKFVELTTECFGADLHLPSHPAASNSRPQERAAHADFAGLVKADFLHVLVEQLGWLKKPFPPVWLFPT
jgi:hypothetical protein